MNARHSSGECRNWKKPQGNHHDNGKCYACESQGKPFHHSFKECKIWQDWNQHKMSGKGGAKNAGIQQSPEQTGGGGQEDPLPENSLSRGVRAPREQALKTKVSQCLSPKGQQSKGVPLQMCSLQKKCNVSPLTKKLRNMKTQWNQLN